MATIEVCRIQFGWDNEQKAKQWVEALLLTTEGEKVIHRVEYWNESSRSDEAYLMSSLLKTFNPFRKDPYGDQGRLESQRLRDNARSRLIGQLIQEGWEPVDQEMMKRVKPES